MVKEEEGLEDECSRLHVHGRSTITVTEKGQRRRSGGRNVQYAQQFCGLSQAHIRVQYHFSTTRSFEIN